MKRLKKIKRYLAVTLALVMTLAAAVPESALAAEARDVGRKITLKAFDVTAGMRTITDDQREMKLDRDAYKEETAYLTADGNLPENLNDLAPKMEGWKFVGWYTAPVKYAFWGDTTRSKWSDVAEIPDGFTKNCDGVTYDFTAKPDPGSKEEPQHKLKDYWKWLSTLDGDGTKVEPGGKLPGGETELYACYKPEVITYKLYYSGWRKMTGALSCSREYGTPLGNGTSSEWGEFEFKGWYKKDGGDGPMDFYHIPEDGDIYVAHWQKKGDPTVNQDTYKRKGFSEAKAVFLMKSSTENSLGTMTDLGDTLNLHTGRSKCVFAQIDPADNGVTDVDWTSSDESVATVRVVKREYNNGTADEDYKLQAEITAAGKPGTAEITVTTENGMSDTVIVDTTQHTWDYGTITKNGDCKTPTILCHRCIYCGKTETVEYTKEHTWAYRDVPATCETPHIWERYCKVCKQVDTEEGHHIFRGEATGHEWKELSRVNVNHGTDAVTYQCTVCRKTETRQEASLLDRTQTAVTDGKTYTTPDITADASANAETVKSSKETSAPAETVNSPKETPASAETVNSQKATPAPAGTANSQKATPATAGTVNSQKATPVTAETVNSPKATPAPDETVKISSIDKSVVKQLAVKLSSVRSTSKKKIKVSWKKNSAANGYQIRYSTNKKFKSGVKTKTIKKNKTTSATISKLAGKKTYYVQIRSYKTVSGKKYYSNWSGKKKIRVKK